MARKALMLLLVALSVLSLCVAAYFFAMAYTQGDDFNFQNSINNLIDSINPNKQNSIPNPNKNTNNYANKNSQETFLKLTSRANDDYLDDTVFIGDSRTQAMYLYDYLPNEKVYAKDGLSHINAMTEKFVDIGLGKAFTIVEALRIQAPKKIYLSFGINGIIWYQKTDFINEYKEMIKMIQNELPNSIIIVTSILPVSKSFEVYEGLSNTKIDDFNTGILELAKELDIFYLDMATTLKDENNTLSINYDSGDGLHLNNDSYKVIFETIYTHAVYMDK